VVFFVIVVPYDDCGGVGIVWLLGRERVFSY
jgi:hypothetical protein